MTGPLPDREPAAEVDYSEDLGKSWLSEDVLAVVTAALIFGAVTTTGFVRLVLIVVAVCAGLLLAWSLVLLTTLKALIALISTRGRR